MSGNAQNHNISPELSTSSLLGDLQPGKWKYMGHFGSPSQHIPNIAIRCYKCWAKTPPATCSNPWLLASTPLVVEVWGPWGARLCPHRFAKKVGLRGAMVPAPSFHRPAAARSKELLPMPLSPGKSSLHTESRDFCGSFRLGTAGRIADEYFVPHPNRTARKDRDDFAFSLKAAVSVSITTSRTFVCVGSRPRTIHPWKGSDIWPTCPYHSDLMQIMAWWTQSNMI